MTEYKEVRHDIFDPKGNVIGFSVSGEPTEVQSQEKVSECGVQYFGLFMDGGGFEENELIVDQPIKIGK